MQHNEKDIRFLVNLAKEQGYIAFIHPRKKTVSINGGKEQDYKEAYHQLFDLTLPF